MKIQEFYESVNRNYDALLSMGEADMLRGFAMSTLNKLPQERPDIARTDENWENWDMEASINNFQQWLKRHKVDNVNGNSGGVRPKREKPWFNEERKDLSVSFVKLSTGQTRAKSLKQWKQGGIFFQEKELCFNCGRTGSWAKFYRNRQL